MNLVTLWAFNDELMRIKKANTFVTGFNPSAGGSAPGFDHRFVPEGGSTGAGFGMQSSGSFQPFKIQTGRGISMQGPSSDYNEVPYGMVHAYTGVR